MKVKVMHACIDDGLVGPQMEASHVSVLARITTACMHVAQRGVVWCLNSQFHNFDVARASETKKSRHWVRCTCSRTRTYSIYASPLPPLRRVLYIYSHHNTNKKDSTLLVKLTSLPAVRQSDGWRPRGPTESVTREYRVSCRTTIDCMWPKHVCMKVLCNVLNNEFTTLMWHRPA